MPLTCSCWEVVCLSSIVLIYRDSKTQQFIEPYTRVIPCLQVRYTSWLLQHFPRVYSLKYGEMKSTLQLSFHIYDGCDESVWRACIVRSTVSLLLLSNASISKCHLNCLVRIACLVCDLVGHTLLQQLQEERHALDSLRSCLEWLHVMKDMLPLITLRLAQGRGPI